MQIITGAPLILLLFLASVTSYAHQTTTEDLQCYVCDNCEKIEKDTPLLSCNEEYFKTGGSTLPATMTTTSTEPPTTEMETTTRMESPTTTEAPTTTTPLETTHMPTTEEATTESTTSSTAGPSTLPPVPTPPTVGPPPSTTVLPTPIYPVQVFAPSNDTHANSTMLAHVPLSRSRRQSPDISSDYTYHCFSVKKNESDAMVTERGCTRVTSSEAVCPHLEALSNGTALSKCVPCTMNECNGSGTLSGTAFATLLLAIVAALIGRE